MFFGENDEPDLSIQDILTVDILTNDIAAN